MIRLFGKHFMHRAGAGHRYRTPLLRTFTLRILDAPPNVLHRR